jgi:hypothetical protein
MVDKKKPMPRLEGTVITTSAELVDFYQLGDFKHQFQNKNYASRIGICSDTARRDELARKVSATNPLVVQLLGKPLPRDPERFRYLSHELQPVHPAH